MNTAPLIPRETYVKRWPATLNVGKIYPSSVSDILWYPEFHLQEDFLTCLIEKWNVDMVRRHLGKQGQFNQVMKM